MNETGGEGDAALRAQLYPSLSSMCVPPCRSTSRRECPMKQTLSLSNPATHIGLGAYLSSPVSTEELKGAPQPEGVVSLEPRVHLPTEERRAVFAAPAPSDDEALITPLSVARSSSTSQPASLNSIREVRLDRAPIFKGRVALEGHPCAPTSERIRVRDNRTTLQSWGQT